jgi:predicted  nucleic acid-binding Zn-ribbon protein
MQEQVALLLELRQVDDRLREMRGRLESRAADLQRGEKEAAAVREALAQEGSRLAQSESRHREGDREVEHCRADAAKFETQLLGVKTNVEYQALLREIAASQQKAREWEEIILAMMEAEEAAQRTIARMGDELRGKEGVVAEERGRYEAELALLKDEQVRLDAQRQGLVARLNPMARSKYERLTANKGDAIVPVMLGSCGGCHYNLPPQTVNEVRRNDRVIQCEGCGRILVWLG